MTNDQFIELFISETQEILVGLNHNLIQLEKEKNNQKIIDDIFRACHTIKGNAGAMAYNRIVVLAHAMEQLLSQLRSGKNINLKPMIPLLFESVDELQALIDNIASYTDDPGNEQILVVKLNALSSETDLTSPQPPTAVSKNSLDAADKLRHVEDGMTRQPSIRVNIEKLDSLVDLVGELHINKIRLAELLQRVQGNEQLKDVMAELNRISNRLQEQTMQLRLLPLKYLFTTYPRMVRDDAHQENKEVELRISGAEIGMDRTVLDEIHDPLVHILRNAVSHGIEKPHEREKAGKPPNGLIQIQASREQNMVVIQIQDDGKGMDINKIKQTIVKQNLMSKEALDELKEEDLFMLVTLPGFSLSDTVTQRAGRGMGMNIVKSKIESIGGHFSIDSIVGKGTKFTLKLPISMAILHGLLVQLGHEICVIPLYNVVEIIKINPKDIKHAMTTKRKLGHIEFVPYRDEIMTLIRLKEQLGFSEMGTNDTEKLSVVVCDTHQQKIGFIVDKPLDKQDIVIKSLMDSMQHFKCFSGETILGNGRVAMILDTSAIIKDLL